MNLILNGQSREFTASAYTVTSLLEELGLGGKPVVVELNHEAVFPASYAATEVPADSSVEIVTIAAGG